MLEMFIVNLTTNSSVQRQKKYTMPSLLLSNLGIMLHLKVRIVFLKVWCMGSATISSIIQM